MRRDTYRYFEGTQSYDLPQPLPKMFNKVQVIDRCYMVSFNTIQQLCYLHTPKYNISIKLAQDALDLCKYFELDPGTFSGIKSIYDDDVSQDHLCLLLDIAEYADCTQPLTLVWTKMSYADKRQHYVSVSKYVSELDCMPDDLSEMDYSFTCGTCHLHYLASCKTKITYAGTYIYAGKKVICADSNQDVADYVLEVSGRVIKHQGKSEPINRDLGHAIYRLLRKITSKQLSISNNI